MDEITQAARAWERKERDEWVRGGDGPSTERAYRAGYKAGLRAAKWRPIETAPKDGSEILLLMWARPVEKWVRKIGVYRDGSWYSAHGYGGKLLGGDGWFTGWAPLPHPPKED